jgi:hypothetical protein
MFPPTADRSFIGFIKSKPGSGILLEHDLFREPQTHLFAIMLGNYPNKAINSSSVRPRSAASGLTGAGRGGSGHTVGPVGFRDNGTAGARTV